MDINNIESLSTLELLRLIKELEDERDIRESIDLKTKIKRMLELLDDNNE